MFEVRVEADFAAAHFLADYHGKCEALHGHNYRVLAHLRGKNLDDGGMVFDFSIIKKILREVCGSLDHKNLNDFEVFKNNPSAERIAYYIFSELTKKLEEQDVKLLSGTEVFCVDVYETPTSRARYIKD